MLDNLFTVAIQVSILFCMMLVGFILGKLKFLGETAASGISSLIMYVATPAAILQSFTSEVKTPEKTRNLFIVFLCAVLAHVIAIIITKLLIHEKDERKRRIMQFSVSFSNCGYMSFPLQKALLGDIGVFYGAMFVAVFNLFIWTYGTLTISGDKKQIKPMRILLNPSIIAVALSILLYATGIKLPSFLSGTVTHLGNLNTPLPMIVIGYNLSTFALFKMFADKKVYLPTALRLVIIPAIFLGALWLLGVTGIPLIACTIAASAPSAAIGVMFATQFGADAALGSKLVSLSTLLSILTMPVFVAIAQMM